MQKQLAKSFGILIAILAVGGLFVEDGHLFGFMNANLALDALRIVLAAALLYVGFGSASARAVRGVLGFTGILYLGMAVLGLADSTLWGLLPSGLTGFDIAFHLLAGAVATFAAYAPSADSSVTHHA
jgi:hypothetical protein